ncbi:hypothetical protein EOPP23_10775 [Endozoicomonas sp. OPT23]|uniref:histidine phosphatase family protein n=1 Tax=Endozoicomonas sp. OPT23 TaxID=2072845 RepID=UPI00129AA698|nr:histidine phosphatase family protein [Endozoicomonas sp. OPT23]MRI33468.1 hypothetical protein [Endozoicomonas sp. OPT23]
MAAKIIIFRHGEGTHNTGEFYSSDPEHPNYRKAVLTELGKQQVLSSVKQVAADLEEKNILAVLSSPLPRALESAQIAMDYLSVPATLLESDRRLIEARAGERESTIYSDYQDEDFWFPEHPESFGGETNEQISSRVISCYRDLIDRYSYKSSDKSTEQGGVILAFSHGVPIYMLIEAVLGKGRGFKLATAGYISLPVKAI